MAKTKISEFSANPANNTDIDSINIAENCAPSGINDAIRELMAQLKDWQSGTSNDPYVVGSSGSLTLSGGTANGVAYLNGSKVLTTGSALTFDGTALRNTSGQFEGIDNMTLSALVSSTNATVLTLNSAGTSGTTRFQINGSEQMRLTSTGLGIGTSSPTAKLDVQGGNLINGNGTIKTGFSYDTNGLMGTLSNHSLGVLVNSTVIARFDTSGNLGLGVTPSAWGSNFKAMQFTGLYGGAVSTSAAGNTTTNLSHSAYHNGTNWVYGATGFGAARYEIEGPSGGATHKWFTAPSGTAGNAISFSQSMTLTAAGELLINRTSASGLGKLNVEGGADFTNGNVYVGRDSGNFLIGTTSGAFTGKVVTLQTTSASNVITAWNSATSGDNSLIGFFTDGGSGRGSISYNRTAGLVAYNTTSDYRAKDIIGPLTDSGAVIDSVPVYMGKMKGATQERPMFIAHETPAYAHTGEKDAVDADGNPVYQQMDASALVPVMWAEIQSLRARVAALESN